MTKTNYTEVKLDISDNQKEKVQLAMKNNEDVTIRISNTGDDTIALTETQINKINKAFEQNKSVNIKLSKAQLKYNKDHVTGGFLGALLGLAASKILPAAAKIAPKMLAPLAHGALSALSSLGIDKIFGNGIYLKKGGVVYKIKDQGSGLYINKANTRDLHTRGDGLFIRDKANNEWLDGSGILSNLLSSVPLLNLVI